MATPRDKDVLVVNAKDQLLIQVKYSAIPALIVASDGLRIHGFPTKKYPQGRIPYLAVTDVLEWHRNELPHTINPKECQEREEVILALEKTLAKHQANEEGI